MQGFGASDLKTFLSGRSPHFESVVGDLVNSSECQKLLQLSKSITERVARIQSGTLSPTELEELKGLNRQEGPALYQVGTAFIKKLYANAQTVGDVGYLINLYLQGVVPGTPCSIGPLSQETDCIKNQLMTLNSMGMLTMESQPGTFPSRKDDEPNLTVLQCPFLDVSIERSRINKLYSLIQAYNQGRNKSGSGRTSIVVSGSGKAIVTRVYMANDFETLERYLHFKISGVHGDTVEIEGNWYFFPELPTNDTSHYSEKFSGALQGALAEDMKTNRIQITILSDDCFSPDRFMSDMCEIWKRVLDDNFNL